MGYGFNQSRILVTNKTSLKKDIKNAKRIIITSQDYVRMLKKTPNLKYIEMTILKKLAQFEQLMNRNYIKPKATIIGQKA